MSYAGSVDVVRAKGRAAAERWRTRWPEKSRASWRKNWPQNLWRSARKRAQQRGIFFDLVPADIEIPERCPVLGIRLVQASGKSTEASATVDRIVPSRGYTKDNIAIISARANRLKNDATAAELKAVLHYIQGA